MARGSYHRLWPARARLGIGPPLTREADADAVLGDAVLGLWVAGRDGAPRARRPGLSPVPLPGVRQAVQRTLRHAAEPNAIPLRCHRARGALASALQTEPARSARDVRRARHRVQP